MAAKKATSRTKTRPLHLSNRDRRGDAAKGASAYADAQASGGRRRTGTPRKPAAAANGQAARATANRALGKVDSGKARPVTISQVQNDKSIEAKDKKTIISALQRRNARRTEG